jgi:hypothetical protein
MTGHTLFELLSWNAAFWTALIAYTFACTGAGLLVLRLLGGERPSESVESPSGFFAVAFLLGLGLLGQLWLLLALAGRMTNAVVYILTGLLAAAAVVLARPHLRVVRRTLRDTFKALLNERLGIGLLLLMVLAWIIATFASLGRPFSGDSLALHMMVAKATAASGALERLWFQPGNEFYGALGEMTYAALMKLGNDDAAQMSTWIAMLASAAVLLGICERAGLGLRGRIFALTALSTSTAVLNWIGEGKVDLIATSLALGSLYWLMPRPGGVPVRYYALIIAGLLAGFAITTKLILGICFGTAAAVLLAWNEALQLALAMRGGFSMLRTPVIRLVSTGLVFGAAVLLGLLPQFIKNGLLLGHPFAPISLTENYASWLVEERWYDAATVAHIRRLYPFVLTFGEYFAQYGQLSVLVLAFAPLCLYLRRPQSFWASPLTAISIAAFSAIFMWATWQGDKVVTRYMLPALILCIPLAAAAAEGVTARSFRPRYLGMLVIAASFAALYMTASFTIGFYYFPAQALKVMLGTALPCERGLLWCGPMDMVNRVAPEGARVLSFSSYKYYLRPDLIQCSYDHRILAFPGATTDERWRWFYSQGYNFILPDTPNNTAHLQQDLGNPPPWVVVTRYQPTDPMGPILISYDLTKGGPTQPPEMTCRQVRPRAWRVEPTKQ